MYVSFQEYTYSCGMYLNLVPKQSMEKHGIIIFQFYDISSYLSIHVYNKNEKLHDTILEFYLTWLPMFFTIFSSLMVAGWQAVSKAVGTRESSNGPPGLTPLIWSLSVCHWPWLRWFLEKTRKIGMYQHYNMLGNNNTYRNIHDLVADSNALIKVLYKWV